MNGLTNLSKVQTAQYVQIKTSCSEATVLYRINKALKSGGNLVYG